MGICRRGREICGHHERIYRKDPESWQKREIGGLKTVSYTHLDVYKRQTLDCSACILTPKMVEASAHERINLFTYSEVEKVSGFVGDFKVDIRKKARSVDTVSYTHLDVYKRQSYSWVFLYFSSSGQRARQF